MQRMKIEEIRKDPWFQRNYIPFNLREDEEVNLDDVQAVFDDIEVFFCSFFFFFAVVLFVQTKFIFANVCIILFLHIYRDEWVCYKYKVCTNM